MIYRLKNRGFTLIEVVITLIIVSIISSIMYSYFNTALIGKELAVFKVQEALDLHRTMEKISTDYEILKSSGDLEQLKLNITDYKYSEDYSIEELTYIKFEDDGTGQFVEKEYAVPTDILKVSIKNDSGAVLTALFTKN